MKRMVQIALMSLFSLTLAVPALAMGTAGTVGSQIRHGTMTGTTNGYGNFGTDTQMNRTGTGMNGTGIDGTGVSGTGVNGTGVNGSGMTGTGMNGTGGLGTGTTGGYGTDNANRGTSGYGTLNTNNDRTGVRARSYTGSNVRGYATTNTSGNNNNNWSWLGLLGLFGLVGMFNKGKDSERNQVK